MADSKFEVSSSSASPPPNCAICLGPCSNKCFSDTCMHQFCFNCLLQWSKIKAECPLCKQAFRSIIHNVRSNEDYEEHIIENRTVEEIHILDNEQYLYLPTRHQFHFRTTVTVDTRGESAIQQMLLSHSLNGITSSPRVGIRYRGLRRRNNATTSFRRSIYNEDLWASAPPDVTGTYRDVTPRFYRDNPAARTRLVPWLNRELNALLRNNTPQIMPLVENILEALFRHHVCSRSFADLVRPHLGDRTEHFIHEFYNFMRSPFDIIGYDRHVIYTTRPTSPTPLIDVFDVEDNDSDVVIVNETNNSNPPIIELTSDSDDDVIVTSEVPMPIPMSPSTHSSSRSSSTSLCSDSDEYAQNARKRRSRGRSTRRSKRPKRERRRSGNEDDSDTPLEELRNRIRIRITKLENKSERSDSEISVGEDTIPAHVRPGTSGLLVDASNNNRDTYTPSPPLQSGGVAVASSCHSAPNVSRCTSLHHYSSSSDLSPINFRSVSPYPSTSQAVFEPRNQSPSSSMMMSSRPPSTLHFTLENGVRASDDSRSVSSRRLSEEFQRKTKDNYRRSKSKKSSSSSLSNRSNYQRDILNAPSTSYQDFNRSPESYRSNCSVKNTSSISGYSTPEMNFPSSNYARDSANNVIKRRTKKLVSELKHKYEKKRYSSDSSSSSHSSSCSSCSSTSSSSSSSNYSSPSHTPPLI